MSVVKSRPSVQHGANLLNEVGLSLFWYFEVGLRVCDIVVKKFTFAISSPDEFLLITLSSARPLCTSRAPCSIRGCIYEFR